MQHIDVNLLMMVMEGELPPRALLQVIYEHLKELCPECRSNLELVLEGDGPPGEMACEHHAPHGDGDDAAAEELHSLAAEVGAAGEERRARRDLAALLDLPTDRWEQRITAAYSRFRGRRFAELLVDASRDTVRRDPARAQALAELVRPVLERSPEAAEATWADEVQARALGHRANALRVGGDLRGADDAFRRTRLWLANHPLNSSAVHAEVTNLEASLRFAQRRMDEAEHLLDRAVLLYRMEGDDAGVAKSLIMRGEVQRLGDDLDGARRSMGEALELLDPREESFLYVCAVGNLALYLCDAGLHAEAAELIADNRRWFSLHDETWTRLRLAGIRGRIEFGLGNLAQAEELFRQARDGYLAEELGYDAALASLDLALLLLADGRTGELKDTAHTIRRLFEAQELHREAMAALLLFQQAVAADQVTVEAIRSLQDYLERARANPELRYQPPA